MTGSSAVIAGSSTAFLTVFGLLGSVTQQSAPQPLPVKRINHDGSLLTRWLSDDLDGDEPLDSECNWYNNTVALDAGACTLFTVSRTPSRVFETALERATRCAAKTQLECVLGAEVGFAIPAAYIADQESDSGMISMIAPKIVAMADEKHVRVSVPPQALFESTTVLMNATVSVEYMNEKKEMKSAILHGKNAFCVQLLRGAYERTCWSNLEF